jgi:TIR domain-containing protein
VAVRNVFISYARANKPDVDQLERHLRELGCNAWLDSWLHGSQDWWQEILRRIEGCDVFIPIISEEALNSVACNREFDWAEALRKPVLPVRMEPTSIPLPRRYSIRQIVDYSDRAQRDHAPIKLASALMSLPPPPAPPQPLPSPPAAPLSYLTDLVDLVFAPRDGLTHDQQHQVLSRLEPALRAVDPEERRQGHAILQRFRNRDDLYADVYRRLIDLKPLNDEAPTPPRASQPQPTPKPRQLMSHPAPGTQPRIAKPIPTESTPSHAGRQPYSGFRKSNLGLPAMLLVVAAITGAIPPIYLLSSNYPLSDDGRIWNWQTASRILIGISFCLLAWIAKSLRDKVAMLSAVLMAPVILLHVANRFVLTMDDLSADTARLLNNIVYPTALGLAAMIGVLFGVAVIRKYRVAWASILIAWGLCGLLEAYLSYLAKVAPWEIGDPPAAAWKAADSVLIVQNLILLTVAVFMFLESRPAKNASAPNLTVTRSPPR